VEALPLNYLKKSKKTLKKEKYTIIEISLSCSLKKCLENNQKRNKRKAFDQSVITEVYDKYNLKVGTVIDVSNKTPTAVFKEIESKYFGL